MTGAEFDFFRRFLKERSGLVLADDKQYLVDSRLTPVARQHGLASVADIAAKLHQPSPALEAAVVEAMTTNESYFFRDKLPFEHFKQMMLPALIAARAGRRKIRIWCAAASTGQEPYSLAMILADLRMSLVGWSVEILATDLSNDVLDRAKLGTYTQFEVQRGLPIQLLVKHFAQRGDQWEIDARLRAMVHFRPLNLLRDFSSLGQFDIVFCRNVLIYFDQPTKVDVLTRLGRQLAPDGFLALGAAETVVGLTSAFVPHADKRGVYLHNPGTDRKRSAPVMLTGGVATSSFALRR